MKPAHAELGRRLSALRADFAALGTRAADAASALAARLPPSSDLLDELTAARDAFAELRSAMVEQAGTLDLVLDAERLGTLRDLEPVLNAIAAAEERHALLNAWEEAREEGLLLLDRAMALIHREDKGFAPLAECQEGARQLHGALSNSMPGDLEHETKMLSGKLRPFAELLALVEGWDVLDDDRCVFLQDAITQSFGRQLALAALRGKLGREGEPPAGPTAGAPAAYAAPAAGAPATAPGVAAPGAVPVVSAPVGAGQPAAGAGYVAGGGPAAGGMIGAPGGGAPVGGVVAGSGVAGGGIGGGPLAGGRPVVPGDGSSVVVEIRLAGDKVSVETPEARREREQLLERLAQEHAQWWIAAREGWNHMRERGVTFADAAHEYIERFPYLLSVPLQKSVEHEQGRLAEGYALLLAHIEKLEDGFVRAALTRLNPQFTTREKDESFPLGQELYLYVVAEGRLYKTYPDFVKEVIVNALPKSDPWVQGRLVETDAQTQIVTRPQAAGSRQETTQTVTDWTERGGPHLFTTTTGPLTTRFFTLEHLGDALEDPPDVEIKLKENDAPTDHAWLITLPAPGKVQPLAPRRHRTGGTMLEGFGREFGGLWIGVFNADPSNERRYELAITLRRKPREVDKSGASPTTAGEPAPSGFFGKKR